MSLEIWKICVIVIGVILIIYSYISLKNGLTEKQIAKQEKFNDRTFTEVDLNEFKRSRKFYIVYSTLVIITLTASMFP